MPALQTFPPFNMGILSYYTDFTAFFKPDLLRQHRTKPAWRLCTPSACRFSVISHKNPLTYGSMPAEFLCNLTKNLTTHLTHNLCAVLP